MYTINSGQLELLRAVFADEFAGDGGIHRDAIDEIEHGDIAEWVLDLGRTGLFSRGEVQTITDAWGHSPQSLIDVLIGTDEVAAKREDRHAAVPLLTLDRTAG